MKVIGKELRFNKRIFELQFLLEGALIGAGAGLVVSAFRFLLDLSDVFREILYRYFPEYPWMIPLWFLVLLLIACVLYRVEQKEPLASGSGIPQVKGVLLGKMRYYWLRVLSLKFFGAVLGIGAGLSLGRQGPSVQFGACIGQGVSHWRAKVRSREEKALIIAGAGAGLAAAFNAPLAGVIFCVEELARRASSFQILSGLIAALTATAVSRLVFGRAPIFSFQELPTVPMDFHYFYFILLGLFCGFLGMLFNRSLLRALDWYGSLPLKGIQRPLVPLLTAGLLGFVLPGILGGGNILVNQVVTVEYSLGFLCVLFLGKFLFTLLCFGSGAPGGIFLPMMALGAVSGAIFGKCAVFFGWLEPVWVESCIVFGMAAYFSGAVKSPVSSSVLIMELTDSFDHMMILLCISLAACMVIDMFRVRPVYDALLNRNLRLRKGNLNC